MSDTGVRRDEPIGQHAATPGKEADGAASFHEAPIVSDDEPEPHISLSTLMAVFVSLSTRMKDAG